MPAQTADPTELRDIAESILTARQYEIWHYHIQGCSAMHIAQLLRLGLRTIERELHAIRLASREAADAQKEGPVRLGVSVQQAASEVAWKPDTVAQQVHRRCLRSRRRIPAYS